MNCTKADSFLGFRARKRPTLAGFQRVCRAQLQNPLASFIAEFGERQVVNATRSSAAGQRLVKVLDGSSLAPADIRTMP